jgi:RNA 2',3'-cyclic 3'-phosphodiesterase
VVRAFVAIVPPAAALAELAAAVAPLRAAAPPGLRWAPAEQWHLTLAFLGEVDDAALPDLTERLARAARRHPPMVLAFGPARRFGDRVLWIRVDAVHESPVSPRPMEPDGPRGASELKRLAASMTAAARRSGIPVDDRPYRPHLTLARGRPGADLRPSVAALREFDGSPWTADVLHLVRSRLGAGPGGTASHEIIGTWPLGR